MTGEDATKAPGKSQDVTSLVNIRQCQEVAEIRRDPAKTTKALEAWQLPPPPGFSADLHHPTKTRPIVDVFPLVRKTPSHVRHATSRAVTAKIRCRCDDELDLRESSTMISTTIGAHGGRIHCHACLQRKLSSVSRPPQQYARHLACRASGGLYSGRDKPERRHNGRRTHNDWKLERRRTFSSSHCAFDSSSTSSSVSPSEVAHFSRLASSWWDPHGPSRLLHLMNPLRHDFIQACLSSTPRPATQKYSYLDVGCGGGIFASSAARLPSTTTVTAIDPTPECIAVAQDKQRSDPALQSPKLNYINCAIENLPEEIQDVDVVTLFEVLEHVPHPSTFLAECAKHLTPGGWIVGSTIARSPMSYLTTKVIAEAPVIGIVPPGTHDWNKYINPSELRDWFEGKAEGDWGEFRTQGVVYVPLLGWKVVQGSEGYGNYFFGVQKLS